MNCKACGGPAIGIVFTKGNPADVPLCKKCGRAPEYKGWMSQSFSTANSATGQMIRANLKGV
jgi:hypothetical protein